MSEIKWEAKFPEEPGYYWFFGYRYGRVSCGFRCKPELMLVRARRVSRGDILCTGDGQFIYESEIEDYLFAKVNLPILPTCSRCRHQRYCEELSDDCGPDDTCSKFERL